jgi:drug/metabolite transporter (DMT)-like permease
MSPFFFLLLAFLFSIANRLYLKYSLRKVDGYALALASNGPGLLILLPFVWNQLPLLATLTVSEVLFIVLTGALWSYVMWVGNITTAFNAFSFQEVVRQTRVLWVVLGGVVLFGESLSYSDICGIGLIVLSVFVISWKQFSLKEHVTSRALLLTWSVTLVGALIVLLEKKIVLGLPVALYTFLAYLLTTLFLGFFLNKKRRALFADTVRTHPFKILVCSLFMLGAYYFGLKSYQLLPISVAYPIIQSSTVVGVLIATVLFEKQEDLFKKVFAASVAVLGVVLIKFF